MLFLIGVKKFQLLVYQGKERIMRPQYFKKAILFLLVIGLSTAIVVAEAKTGAAGGVDMHRIGPAVGDCHRRTAASSGRCGGRRSGVNIR